MDKDKTKDQDKDKSKKVPDSNVKVDLEPSIDPVTCSYEEAYDWLVEGDYSDKDEITSLVEDCFNEIEDIGEALSIANRVKRRNVMRRFKSKIKNARKRHSRKRASTDRIKKRAKRSAILSVKKKVAGGRSIKKLSFAERARVERIASKRKTIIARTSKRLVRVKRQQERMRMSKK